MKTFFQKFFGSNELQWRLFRTIVQGVIGVLVTNLDALLGAIITDPLYKTMVTGVIMAILSPIFAEIGKAIDNE